MSEPLSATHSNHVRLRRRIQVLQTAVYARPDPTTTDLLQQLTDAQTALVALEQQPVSPPPSASPTNPVAHGRFLGPETTGLRVTPTVNMQPLPTGVYHLLDPETDPLVTVVVSNESRERTTRRVCVKVYLEGLSAEAVRTVEIKRHESATLKFLPTLLPERARALTEAQRATLHVVVTDLDNKPESHDTFSVLCLARTSSFNTVRRPGTDEPVDLTDYYGAWVTPHAEAVQERLRRAVDLCPGGMLMSYQADAVAVAQQVAALFQALHEAGLAYVNSVIDFGAASGLATQRTRLPRESLVLKSANCIDGAVLFASLLEGVSLNAALVFVPGHAFVGWQTGDDESAEWRFLETTLIGAGDFDAACKSGQRQYEEARKYYPKKVKLCKLPDLRARGIWPME